LLEFITGVVKELRGAVERSLLCSSRSSVAWSQEAAEAQAVMMAAEVIMP
jgi:hypothetical protein